MTNVKLSQEQFIYRTPWVNNSGGRNTTQKKNVFSFHNPSSFLSFQAVWQPFLTQRNMLVSNDQIVIFTFYMCIINYIFICII